MTIPRQNNDPFQSSIHFRTSSPFRNSVPVKSLRIDLEELCVITTLGAVELSIRVVLEKSSNAWLVVVTQENDFARMLGAIAGVLYHN